MAVRQDILCRKTVRFHVEFYPNAAPLFIDEMWGIRANNESEIIIVTEQHSSYKSTAILFNSVHLYVEFSSGADRQGTRYTRRRLARKTCQDQEHREHQWPC